MSLPSPRSAERAASRPASSRQRPLGRRARLAACAAAVGPAIALAGCSGASEPYVATLVVDRTASSDQFAAAIEAHSRKFVAEVVAGNDFDELTIVGIGGGPSDVVTVTVDISCDGTDRQCADVAVVEEATRQADDALTSVLAAAPAISGSAPLGAVWEVLSRAGEHDEVLVISDFAEHSDLLDLSDGVDLSTTDTRGLLVDAIADAGQMDFAGTDLAGIEVTVALVPAESGAVSTPRFRQMQAFVEELLGADQTDRSVVVAPIEMAAAAPETDG